MGIDLPETKALEQQLTPQEMLFVEYYMQTWNAAQAALRAGYCTNNPNNARTAGFEIRNKPYIQRAIANRMFNVCMETNEVLGRLAAIARGDITDFLTFNDETGEWDVDIRKIKESGMGFLIKTYEQPRFGRAKIELYSSQEALDRIARYLGLYTKEDDANTISLSAWGVFVQAARNGSFENPPVVPINGKFVDSTTGEPATSLPESIPAPAFRRGSR